MDLEAEPLSPAAAEDPAEPVEPVEAAEPSRKIKVPPPAEEQTPEITGNDVFSRLLRDAAKRRTKRPESLNSVQKPAGPRRNIEADLIERNKQLKAKLRQKQAAALAQQRLEETGIPDINPTSRRLASGSKSGVDDPPRQVEHIANTLKRPGANLVSLGASHGAVLDVKVNLSKFYLSQVTDPQAVGSTDWAVTPSGVHYSSMKQLNGEAAEEQASPPPKYLDEETDVVKRTLYWFKQKQERIKQQQEEKASHELDGCTFKPQISNRKRRAGRLDKAASYSTTDFRVNLSPSRNKVCYPTGFNFEQFKGRAQPMLNYKDLAAEEQLH